MQTNYYRLSASPELAQLLTPMLLIVSPMLLASSPSFAQKGGHPAWASEHLPNWLLPSLPSQATRSPSQGQTSHDDPSSTVSHWLLPGYYSPSQGQTSHHLPYLTGNWSGEAATAVEGGGVDRGGGRGSDGGGVEGAAVCTQASQTTFQREHIIRDADHHQLVAPPSSSSDPAVYRFAVNRQGNA